MGDLIFVVSWGIFPWERYGALHCMVWLVALGFFYIQFGFLGLGNLGIWDHGRLASKALGHGQDHHLGSLCLSGFFFTYDTTGLWVRDCRSS